MLVYNLVQKEKPASEWFTALTEEILKYNIEKTLISSQTFYLSKSGNTTK